jgi:hypothetical protein
MPRSMVGLLAAAGTAMSAFLGLAHSALFWIVVALAAAVTDLANARPLAGKVAVGGSYPYHDSGLTLQVPGGPS